MRPPRVAILALFFAASLFLLCRSIGSMRRPEPMMAPQAPPKTQFRSFFSFTAPFSLFPPNAAISLTDDNSTFFPARPAAFGPPLPSKGLSGQLWIGSGFDDDNLQDGEGQGELGCSDVPGWEDGASNAAIKLGSPAFSAHSKSAAAVGKSKSSKRDDAPPVDRAAALDLDPEPRSPHVDDGTDDYLHESLHTTPRWYHDSPPSGTGHADIQSMQETAEITGKVVLLRRGGCGFLEKVKWAQRRGAIAVIVGDNQKGGPLIQMFARGDTSNVTVPAIFTAHTTAHLLSSLMQPGSFIEDTMDERGHAALKVQHFDKSRKNKKPKQPTATTTAAAAPATPDAKPRGRFVKRHVAAADAQRRGWFSTLFGRGRASTKVLDTSRPPSSGRLNWVLVDDWNDEGDKIIRTSLEKASRDGDPSARPPQDSFQIGVQDWRDPDLVDAPSQKDRAPAGGRSTGRTAVGSPSLSAKSAANGPKGGSITPGSGEYAAARDKATGTKTDGSAAAQGGFMAKIFGDDDDSADSSQAEPQPNLPVVPGGQEPRPPGTVHEGLWVTITPTSSASPFFDTLLVLVISPLITLSVVYALLILRARIRRRRWRAPKSVVERLPVRTFHTIAASPIPSPRLPSPTSSSPTTPLLQTSAPPLRPRSRTTTGVRDMGDQLLADAALHASRPSYRPEHDMSPTRLSSQWKKYMGRQIECVVCLEEYVDGVSRVMSLPCGHEFHVECITPWLTTRRRTCPICKGDVVRSLARGSPSSPRYEPYHDDSSDDDARASSSSRPTHPSPPRAGDADEEQGYLSPARPDNWLSALSSNLSSNLGAQAGPSRSGGNAPQDRDR